MTHTIFIDGEAGTTGLEIRQRLEAARDLEFISLTGDRRKDPAARREALNAADAVILCLPDEAAKEAVAMIENTTTRVIDASTAFRVADRLDLWLRRDGRGPAGERSAARRRVSNPGCYPTGFIGLVRPLVKAGLMPADWPVTVNAVSGYSGGGKAMIAEFEDGRGPARLSRLWPVAAAQARAGDDETFGTEARRAVRAGRRRLSPGHAGRGAAATRRPCRKRRRSSVLHGALVEAYDGCRFVEVAGLDETEAMTGLDPEGLNGTNRMRLHVFGDRDGSQARLVALLDNLGKGASGAAVQNLNLMLGLDEATGLI